MDHLSDTDKLQLASDIKSAFMELEYDVALRNQYMNKRDRYIYGDGLWETLSIPDGFDKTLYNYCRRAVDIHVAQFAGRGYQVYSNYNKEDLSIIDTRDDIPDDQKEQQKKLAELRNKRAKTNADIRKRLLDAVRRDNDGPALMARGAKIGSAYGETIFKQWADWDAKKVRRTVIETPQNYRAGWTDTDFRQRDWDGYVYQISMSQAKRKYGDKIPEGAQFEQSYLGMPFQTTGGNTSDPLDQNTTRTNIPVQTERKMVSVIDITGYINCWGVGENGKFGPVKDGKETRFSALMVGGYVVDIMTREDRLPTYYRIPNQEVPQRAWGESDIPESALQINATILERMSDWITVANKTLFPLIQAKGFEVDDVPQKPQRKMTVVAMDTDQALEAVAMPNNFGFDYQQIISKLEDAFIRVVGIGRVLWDDPQQANSNQALMTTMKGVIDIVEGKQKLWEPVLLQMEQDALDLIAKLLPENKEVVQDESFLYLVWPSVMHREDAAYQQMWLNLFNAGTISLDTFLLKTTDVDTSEEIDRLRDNMTDPITAAVLGHQLAEIAHQTLNKSLGIPPWGYIIPKVNIKGELTPPQEGNMAQNFGWGDGPFGNAMGPQGNQGDAANQNMENAGFVNGNAFDGGTPILQGPGGQPYQIPQAPGQPGVPVSQAGGQQPVGPSGSAPAPNVPQSILTPDQNTGQSVSQPGSGAPAISPHGAIKKHNQNHGR